MISRKICQFLTHFTMGVYFLVSHCPCAKAEANCRKPANFVPDDDVIVVPLIIEKSIVDRFHEKHQENFDVARKKIIQWQAQETYAKDYGLENAGFLNLPTAEEKMTFFKRNYLRFVSKDIEKSGNNSLRDAMKNWTADDEIDSIKSIEYREKILVKVKKDVGHKQVKTIKKIKVFKDDIKLGVQVRPEIGMMKLTLKSKYFFARTWLGINGNQELKVEKKFKKTNTTALFNYYIDQSIILAAVDQKLAKHLTFRVSHTKNADGFDQLNRSGTDEATVFQVRFNRTF